MPSETSTPASETRGTPPQPVLKYVRSRNPSFSFEPFPRPVVFTHIPKTGGTTLDHIFKAVIFYQRRNLFRAAGTLYAQFFGHGKDVEALESYRRARNWKIARADYITGHLPYGVHERLARASFQVTLLRDPVERCLSHYRFGLARGGWDAGRSVADLFASGALKDNCQVRQISGMTDPAEACTVEHLARAKDHLANRYDLVGTTERFDDFLRELVTRLGLPHVVYTAFQVTDLRPDPAAEEVLRGKFAEFNGYDAELYDFARELVDSRVPAAPGLQDAGPADPGSVLLVSRHLKFGEREFALLPAAVFEQQARELERQGILIVRTG